VLSNCWKNGTIVTDTGSEIKLVEEYSVTWQLHFTDRKLREGLSGENRQSVKLQPAHEAL